MKNLCQRRKGVRTYVHIHMNVCVKRSDVLLTDSKGPLQLKKNRVPGFDFIYVCMYVILVRNNPPSDLNRLFVNTSAYIICMYICMFGCTCICSRVR